MISDRRIKARYTAMKHKGMCGEWKDSYEEFHSWFRKEEEKFSEEAVVLIRRIVKTSLFCEDNCFMMESSKHAAVLAPSYKVEKGIYANSTYEYGKRYIVTFHRNGRRYRGIGNHKTIDSARIELADLMDQSSVIVFREIKNKRECVVYDEGIQFRLRYQSTVDGMLVGWYTTVAEAKRALTKGFVKAVKELIKRKRLEKIRGS